MIRSVLVPLDASPFGEHALPAAISLARRADATLHLAHVHVPVPPPAELEGTPYYDTMFYGAVMDREREYMEAMGERVSGIEGVRAETTLLSGAIPVALQEHAEATGASIVVLSTHGYEGLRRLLQHGLVDRLLRRLPGPVLAVRPEEDRPPPDDLAEEVAFEHVLVPLDGTPGGEGVLPHAITVARLFDARLTLLRPADPAAHGAPGAFGQEAPADAGGGGRSREIAERYLGRVAAEVGAAGLPVDTRVELTDDPADTILSVAREDADRPVDLIAMDTRARKGIARLLHGSVAGTVLQESPVPMLLHHTERDEG